MPPCWPANQRKGSIGREFFGCDLWHACCCCDRLHLVISSETQRIETQCPPVQSALPAAIALAKPVATGELALVPAGEPVAVGSLDLPELEFDDPDPEPSAVVRLSVKRSFDVLVSALALLLLSPVMLLVAALIKLG